MRETQLILIMVKLLIESLLSMMSMSRPWVKNLQDKIEESPPHAKPPSADSVNILLKQALGADDRALLFDCLYKHKMRRLLQIQSHCLVHLMCSISYSLFSP